MSRESNGGSAETEVLELLGSTLGLADLEVIRSSENLFDLGMDSFGFVTLVVSLEKRYGLHFTDEELMSESFLTADGIVALLRLRQGATHDAG